MSEPPKLGFGTRLVQVGRTGTKQPGYVNPPVVRGSTYLYATVADRMKPISPQRALGYGIGGTQTHHALEDLISEIEGGTRCQIVSSGLAAVTVPLLAYLSAGDHCLMPDSVYGPTRLFCDGMLRRLGVETTYYEPTISESGLAAMMRGNTRVVFAESPGSHTFEVQDVPALARVAHAHGAKLLMDNTWGLHFFQPFRHGVDVSIQALTKFANGHSDVLLGSFTTRTDEDYAVLREGAMVLGQYASSDDCWLTLRGLRTLGVRLRQHMEAGLKVARWFQTRPEVARVLHPALPGGPGHEVWRRDFSGAPGLFGVDFTPDISIAAMHAMLDRLTLFGIGSSWGGYESLALPTNGNIDRTVDPSVLARPSARFHIGLEDPDDLIADLQQAFAALRF
jgi:cystathionine beta-lyase